MLWLSALGTRRFTLIAAMVMVLVGSAASAQTTVTTPGLTSGDIPVANGSASIVNMGSVNPHYYFGNSTSSSSPPIFVQPTGVDINYLRTTIGDTNASLSSSYLTFCASTVFTAARTWTFPTAASYSAGTKIYVCDQGGYVTAINTLTLAENGSDTFNGAANNVVVSVPKSWVVATTDGVSNWTVNVVSPPKNSVDLTDIGAWPISIDGDSQCTWTTSGAVSCTHVWTSAEALAIAADNLSGAHRWKVDIQYAGSGGAGLLTYITSASAGSSNFTIGANPTTASAPSPSTAVLKAVDSITVQAQGSGYNFASRWQLVDPNASGPGGAQVVAGQFYANALQPVSATVATGGTGGPASGSLPCVLAPTSGTAIGGTQSSFSGTFSSGALVSTSSWSGGIYTSMGSYAYDATGAFDAVPVTCGGAGGWSGGNVNVKMGWYTLQDTFGRNASDGVYVGQVQVLANKWCGGGVYASATLVSGTDHGSGGTVSCTVHPALVWAGYDNHTVLGNEFAALNVLAPSQRPAIRINGIFLVTPFAPSVNSITGKTVWKGDAVSLDGWFVYPGTVGAVMPVVDSNYGGSQSPTGQQVGDGSIPDESGSMFSDFTCWGDQTSTAKPQNCTDFFGVTQRLLEQSVWTWQLPGCIWCVGEDSVNSNGSIAESMFLDARTSYSGDETTYTPAMDFGTIGTTAGANNDRMWGYRAFDDYYGPLDLSNCNDSGGTGAQHDIIAGAKVENSGMDQYHSPVDSVLLNDQSCSNGARQWLTTASTTNVIGSAATAAGGGSSIQYLGLEVGNPSQGGYAFHAQAAAKTDLSNVQVVGGDINAVTANNTGGGVYIEGCQSACITDWVKDGTADYQLRTGASSLVNAGAIQFENNGIILSAVNIGSGVTVTCAKGIGQIATSGSPAGTCVPNVNSAVGMLPNSAVPAPSTSSCCGGVEAASAATSNQFVTYVDSSGTVHTAQPSFSDLSGQATNAQLATDAGNTVLGNFGSASAQPSANSVPSCSATGVALNYTSGTGFNCQTGLAPTSSPTLTTPEISGCTTQGDVFYVNSSGAITCLAPGTSGRVFTTGGSGANPSWASAVTWYVATTNATFVVGTQYYQPLSGWSATLESGSAVKAGTEFASGMTGTFGGSPGGLPGFQCNVQTAPGSGKSDTCSLMQGTTSEASCTISGTATSCTSTTSVSMVTGANYVIGFEANTGATAPGTVYSSVAFASP